MRFAFVSDIHANLQAWRAVWPDTVAHNVDRVICLGDIVGYGPRPAETLSDIYTRASYFVVGNHDAAVAGLFDASQFSDDAQRMIAWTRERLGSQAFDLIKQLPYAFQIDAGGFDAVCVHASMSDPAEFDYIFEEEDARAHWAACEERLAFVGHTHVPQADVLNADDTYECLPPGELHIEPDKRYIINVGSVGMPRDNDFRAVYCIYDTETHTVSWHRTAYDVEGLKEDIKSLIGTSSQAEYMLASFEAGGNVSVRERLDFAPRQRKRTITVHRRTTRLRQHTAAESPPPSTQEEIQEEATPAKRNQGLPVALWVVLGLMAAVLFLGAPIGVISYRRAQKRAVQQAKAVAAQKRREQEEAYLARKREKTAAAMAALQQAIDVGLAGDRNSPATAAKFDAAEMAARKAGIGAIADATRKSFLAGRTDTVVWPDSMGRVLIKRGNTWILHASAQRPGDDWMKPGFRATGWSSGKAPMGYGDDNEATELASRTGRNGPQPYLVAYFRKSFEVVGGVDWVDAKIKLRRDDGAVVYLNGHEVWRSNMPEGKIGPTTQAAGSVNNAEENVYYSAMVGTNYLTAGINVIAVSVHQASPTSSDLKFDLELIGYPKDE